MSQRFNLTFREYVKGPQVLHEGLSVSYGADVLQAQLSKSKLLQDYIVRIYVLDIETILSHKLKDSKYGKVGNLRMYVRKPKEFKSSEAYKEFQRILDLCGYYVVRVFNSFDLQNKKPPTDIYNIEPKFPMKVKKEDLQQYDIYHVTEEKSAQQIVGDEEDKIRATGLLTKASKTAFEHPGDRIYLFATDRLGPIRRFADVLENGHFNRSKMVVLKVDPAGLSDQLYIDPSFEADEEPDENGEIEEYVAFFSLRPIGPEYLSIVKI
jgi:hypothetical protein